MTRRVMRGFKPALLRSAREARGLGVSDAARLSGINPASLGRWEAGTRSPQVDALRAVLEVLGCTIQDVVDVPKSSRFPGDWRVLRGLTQPQLGKLAGVSTSAIGRIERGEGGLSNSTRDLIAAALEIQPDELTEAFERAQKRPPGEPA